MEKILKLEREKSTLIRQVFENSKNSKIQQNSKNFQNSVPKNFQNSELIDKNFRDSHFIQNGVNATLM